MRLMPFLLSCTELSKVVRVDGMKGKREKEGKREITWSLRIRHLSSMDSLLTMDRVEQEQPSSGAVGRDVSSQPRAEIFFATSFFCTYDSMYSPRFARAIGDR